MHKKRGQGLSFNMIVIACLALIVLGVVAYIFIDKTDTASQAITDCEKTHGGVCAVQCGENFAPVSSKCPDARPICCKRMLKGDPIKVTVERLGS